MSKKKVVAIGAGVFLLGVGIGAANGRHETVKTVTQSVAVPGPTVTKPAIIQTVTPQDCLAALDAADQAFSIEADGWQAALSGDGAQLSGDAAKLKALAPSWHAHEDACRASAADWAE